MTSLGLVGIKLCHTKGKLQRGEFLWCLTNQMHRKWSTDSRFLQGLLYMGEFHVEDLTVVVILLLFIRFWKMSKGKVLIFLNFTFFKSLIVVMVDFYFTMHYFAAFFFNWKKSVKTFFLWFMLSLQCWA